MVHRKQRELNKKLNISKYLIMATILIIVALSSIYLVSDDPKPELTRNNESKSNSEIKTGKTAKPKIEPVKQHIRLPQIEILNGCGISNITGLFKSFFKKHKIDVISTGNYEDFNQKNSFLILHSDRHRKLAEQIATGLGLKEKYLKYEIEGNPLQEFTLVLGSDFTKLQYK